MQERIKQLRLEKGLTKKQVAACLGCCPATYSRYETGKTAIPIRRLAALGRLYQVSADYLLGFCAKKLPLPQKNRQ